MRIHVKVLRANTVSLIHTERAESSKPDLQGPTKSSLRYPPSSPILNLSASELENNISTCESVIEVNSMDRALALINCYSDIS